MTTTNEELDNTSCDQLATGDKTNEQKIKTVQRKQKFRIEDAEPTAYRKCPIKTACKSEGNQPGRYGGNDEQIIKAAGCSGC